MNTSTNAPTQVSLEQAKALVKDAPKATDFELQERLDKAQHSIEMNRLEQEAGKLRLKEIEHKHEDQIANRVMRQNYAKWVFYYLVGYSIFVGGLVVLTAMGDPRFTISDDVLQILVGSTAVSAIGLVLAVTTGLFGKNSGS